MEITLGNRLNNLMTEQNLTGKQLATDTGITEGTISKILTGANTNPKSDTIIALAKYFNVSSDYLLGLSNYSTQEMADIGEEIGLSEKAIDLIMKKRWGLEKAIEILDDICNTDDEIKGVAFVNSDILSGHQIDIENVLNQFIIGLYEIQDDEGLTLIDYISSCRDSFIEITNYYKFKTNNQSKFDPEDKAIFFSKLIFGEQLFRRCSNLIIELLHDCARYDPEVVKEMVDSIEDTEDTDTLLDEKLKLKFKERLWEKEGDTNGND